MIRLPYFNALLARLDAGHPALDQAFGRHVHWGYWSDPLSAKPTAEDFAQAAEALSREVCDAGRIAAGLTVLDAGCGFGGTIASLNQRYSGMRLCGLNLDRRQLARADRQTAAAPGNTLAWLQADGCTLPLGSASVDRVLAVECLFHFPSRQRFFAESFRVLKPGGTLALSDFLPAPALKPLFRLATAGSARLGFYGYCNLHQTLDDYRELAARTGFIPYLETDITAATLPTYTYLRTLARELHGLGPTAAIQTLFAEWASRAGALRYWILGFQKPSA